MSKRLWLTYAWKDNESNEVDFVLQELSKRGLAVKFDRQQIIPGQRLWTQIDKAITNSDETDAWAIYVTENSLRSEPCMEEIAYALDRALRAKGAAFPLIGIFPRPLDRALIPSAIATRLYVNLQSPDWAEQIIAGVERRKPKLHEQRITPFYTQFHKREPVDVLEVRPRAGRWYPFVAFVPKSDRSRVSTLMSGPSGHVPGAFAGSMGSMENDVNVGMYLEDSITAERSAYIFFSECLPSMIHFGQREGEIWWVNFKGGLTT